MGDSVPFLPIVFGIEDAPTSPKLVLLDPHRHVWVRLNISHPLGVVATLGHQVKTPLIGDEPDLDLARLPGLPTHGGKVQYTLALEGVDIRWRHPIAPGCSPSRCH